VVKADRPLKRPPQAQEVGLVVGSSQSSLRHLLVRKTIVANTPDYPNAARYNKTTKRGDFDPQSQSVGNGGTSGGSQATPQAALMKKGNGALSGSYPKNAQKIRG
jgi:hypothetical protein